MPRHLFVDEELCSRAYEDSALPIGQGQTVSQPYVVALMIYSLLEQAGELRKPIMVLAIGTACGCQTAALAPFAKQLFSIERDGQMLVDAKARLRSMGVSNAHFRHEDGFQGWPGQAPFDGIIVTSAPPEVPERLKSQLAIGARLILLVGQEGRTQQLLRITRTDDGFDEEELANVSFVPMLQGKNNGERDVAYRNKGINE